MAYRNEKEQTGGRKPKNKQKKRGSRIFCYGAIVLVVLLLITGLWLRAAWEEAYELVLPGRENPAGPAGEKEPDLPEIMNILLLGLDSRDPAMRADTIMLLTLNRRNDEINILSIPRDMRVEIPGHGLDKINHSHVYGGIGLTREVVENFLGVKIDHYMTTDFKGFENIVDILGGIELDVEKEMRYYGIDVTIELDAGLQKLDGDKALQYVRWRSDSEADIGRVRRQQHLLKILLDEALAFRNVLKLTRIVPELAQNIKTDLELDQVVMLANKLRGVDIAEINTCTLPGRPGKIQGISYVLPQEDEIRQLVERYVKGNHVEQS